MRLGIWTPLPHTVRVEPEMAVAIDELSHQGKGGTADRLLASIMVQPHAYTIPRGADQTKIGHYPQGRLFIQR